MYTEIMQRIESSEEDKSFLAYRSLSWILFARRPLTIRELSSAISHEYDFNDPTKSVEYPSSLNDERSILDACQGLLAVDVESKTVGFTHIAIGEFLQNYYSDSVPMWKKFLKDASADITSTCLFFMGAASRVKESSLADRKLRFPLLSYAASFWVYHAFEDERPETLAKYLESYMFLKFWHDILLYEGVMYGFFSLLTTNLLFCILDTDTIEYNRTIVTPKGDVPYNEVLRSSLSTDEIAEVLGLQKTKEVLIA